MKLLLCMLMDTFSSFDHNGKHVATQAPLTKFFREFTVSSLVVNVLCECEDFYSTRCEDMDFAGTHPELAQKVSLHSIEIRNWRQLLTF